MAIEIFTGRRGIPDSEGSRRVLDYSLPPGTILYLSSDFDNPAAEYHTRGSVGVKIKNGHRNGQWQVPATISQLYGSESRLHVGQRVWLRQSTLNDLRSSRAVHERPRKKIAQLPQPSRPRFVQGTLGGVFDSGSQYYEDGY